MRRYRRSYRKKSRNSKDKLVFILLFGIISPVIAITLGFFLVKYIIYPQFIDVSYKASAITEEISNKEKNESKLNIFNIQTGSFNELDNANSFKDSLNSKGIPAYVVKLDNYKVFSGTFLVKKDAEEFKEYLEENLDETFLHENIVAENKGFSDKLEDEDKKNINKLIKKYNEIYSSETSAWKKALISKDIKDIKSLIDKNNEKLTKAYKSMNKENKITKKIDLILESRKEIGKELSENNILIYYSNYTKNLISYIDILRNKKD